MRLATLTTSVSRSAGGLFHSVRGLSKALYGLRDTEVSVLGLVDEYSETDKDAWKPIVPEVFRSRGSPVLGFSPTLRQNLLRSEADIVHQHGIWQYTSIAAKDWHNQTTRPYLVSPRGMLDPWALKHSHWKKCLAGWLFQNSHLRSAACIHALCEAEVHAVRAYGLNNPVCIIPNGVDLPTLARETDEKEIQPSSPVGFSFAEGKTLLYLGRLHEKKGLVNLIKAWSRVQKAANRQQPVPVAANRGNWRLAIAGWSESGHLQELFKLCKELGLRVVRSPKAPGATGLEFTMNAAPNTGSVVFLGPLFGADREAAYRSCDAFILPSYSEGLPMSVLEAWSYAKPVLLTPECNLHEGFTANAAIRIEQEPIPRHLRSQRRETAPMGIEAGLMSLFDASSAELSALGENGRRLVAEKFNWQKVAADMRSVYEWVLGSGCTPECVQIVEE